MKEIGATVLGMLMGFAVTMATVIVMSLLP